MNKGAIKITIQQKISGAMAASGRTQQEIASAFGISQQAFSQRLKTGKFTPVSYTHLRAHETSV